MSSYEYHQILQFLYFEGYADSYAEAEELVESLSDDEFYGIYENVSGGRARRASSRRAPISQRVSDSEAKEIRRNARENPKPTASTPEDDSLEAMKSRFKAETDTENAEKEAKKPKSVPSRGIGPSEPVLRKGKRSTPGGTAQQRVTELGRRGRREGKKPYAPGDEERSKRISAALKKRDKWGTPEAAKEEFVIDYLVTEGYTDNYDSAISIYESMSDEWLDTILESEDSNWNAVRKSASRRKPSTSPIRVGREPVLKSSDVTPPDPEVTERRKKRAKRLNFEVR